MPSCVFCEILRGERPAAFVAREERAAVFLDARPLRPGHCLVVPPAHVENLADAPPEVVAAVFTTAQRVALAAERALGADGAFVALNHRVSQSVPHLHVHVVPRRQKDGLRGFFWPRARYANDEEREEIRAKLAAAMLLQYLGPRLP